MNAPFELAKIAPLTPAGVLRAFVFGIIATTAVVAASTRALGDKRDFPDGSWKVTFEPRGQEALARRVHSMEVACGSWGKEDYCTVKIATLERCDNPAGTFIPVVDFGSTFEQFGNLKILSASLTGLSLEHSIDTTVLRYRLEFAPPSQTGNLFPRLVGFSGSGVAETREEPRDPEDPDEPLRKRVISWELVPLEGTLSRVSLCDAELPGVPSASERAVIEKGYLRRNEEAE